MTGQTGNPLIDLTNKQVDPATGLDVYKPIDKPLGFHTSRGTQYTTQDPTKYAKYFDNNVHLEFGQDYLDPLRAVRQSGLEQLGSGLLQSAGEIVGGTLEGLGYLGDIPQTVNALRGVEEEWGNWLSDIGKSLKSWTQEVAPIYQDPNDIGKFRPNKWSWWMSNAPSIASTLSLMIPASGAVKGASMLGKAMGISGEMGKTARFLTTASGQAVASRLMENGMEASQAFDQTYNELLRIGIPEEKARQAAGVQASDLWNKEWVMLAQDIPQYMLLSKGLNKASRALTKPVAKELGLGKATMRNLTAKQGTALLTDALSEGGEEVFQYVLADRATHLAKAAIDNTYDYKPSARDYIKEGELWSSFTLGALGSTVFQTAGRKINKLIQGKEKAVDARVENVASWAPEIKIYRDALQTAKASGNEQASKEAASQLAVALAAKASIVGNAGALRNTLNDIYENAVDEDRATQLGMSPEDRQFISKNYESIIADVDNTIKAYEAYAKKYDNDIAGKLAANDVHRKRTNQKLKDYKNRREELKKNIIGFDDLSPIGQQIETFKSMIESSKRTKAGLEERLKNDKELNKTEQKEIQDRIDFLNKRIEGITELNKEAIKDRTKEEAAADKQINIDGADRDAFFDNEYNIAATTEQLSIYDNADKIFRSEQTKRNKGEKKSKYKTPDISSNNPEDQQIITETQEEEETPERKAESEPEVPAYDPVEEQIMQERMQQMLEAEERENKAKQEKQAKKDTSTSSNVNTSTTPKKSKPDNTQPRSMAELANEGSDADFETSENADGGVDIKQGKQKKSTPVIPTVDNTVQEDDVIDSTDLDVKDDNLAFNELTDDSTYINFVGKNSKGVKGEDRSPAQKLIDNPKIKIGDYELVFSIDQGEFFDKQFGSDADRIRKAIADGNKDLLKSNNTLNHAVDNIPIKVNLRNKKTKEIIEGDFYVYRSLTKPDKANPDIQKKCQQHVQSLRQKLLEGLLEGKEVTSAFKRSAGIPILTSTEGVNITEGLNIDPVKAKIVFAIDGGILVDTSNIRVKGRGNSKGGGVYVMVNSSCKGTKRALYPIRLKNQKISKEHAEIIFEAFEQVAKGSFATVFTGRDDVQGLTCGEVLSYLVHHGENNTSQALRPDPREELKPKQLWLRGNKLVYGTHNINLKNYTEQQKEAFIEHINTNKNYITRRTQFPKKLDKPFKLGSFEVRQADVDAGLTFQAFYLNNNCLTANTILDDNGSSHENSKVYIEFKDVNSINYNDVPAKETPIKSKPTSIADLAKEGSDEDFNVPDKRKYLDDLMGLDSAPRLYEGKEEIIADIESEVNWLKDKLGDNVPVEVVDDFIKVLTNTGSQLAYGAFQNNAIQLYKNAAKGTGYHEAFHAVFRMYLSYEERERILDEAAKRYGIERSYTHKNDESPKYHIAENRINFVLKVVNQLRKIAKDRQTIRLNTKENPYIEKNLRKALSANVPAEQIDFIFEYMKANNLAEINTEELAIRLSSEYAYNVESNITKRNVYDDQELSYDLFDRTELTADEFNRLDLPERIEDTNDDQLDIKNIIKEDENFRYSLQVVEGYRNEKAVRYRKKTDKGMPPAQYYSNLTVPGGTNYTENEIRTPDITPSIKGHAEFSTDQGIGWFRSDDKAISQMEKREMWNPYTEEAEEYEEERGSVDPIKTRRILELQSDLFQKSRDKKNLVNQEESVLYKGKKYIIAAVLEEGYQLQDPNSDDLYDGPIVKKSEIKELNPIKNQFLQLLNKDNNWVTFFIKSIIQDSAKKGYEKVLFPKGETAAKIEGHETIAEELENINELIREAEEHNQAEELERLQQRKQELKSQGVEKLKPIEAFYEIRIQNILKKLYGNKNVKTITDEYGNKWLEVQLDYEDTITNILLKTEDKSYYETLPGDVRLEEKLADAFQNYILTDKKVQPKPGLIKRFFRKLYDFITNIFINRNTKVDNIDIDGLFDRIERGYYKEATVIPDALSSYTPYDKLTKVADFSNAQLYSLTRLVLYKAVDLNNILSIKDISDLKLDSVKSWVVEQRDNFDKFRKEDSEFEHLFSVFDRLSKDEVWSEIESLVDDMLGSMHIRKIEEHDDDYRNNEFEQHTKASYEYSSRDNMLANIKLFIATIPSNNVDSYTGFRSIVDFDTAWNRIKKDLYDATTPEDMIERIKTKAKSDLFYQVLLNGNKNRPGLANATDNFKTQFFVSIKTHKHDFVKVIRFKDGNTIFQNAELTSMSNVISDTWAIQFGGNSELFNSLTGKPNVTRLNAIKDKYNLLVKTFDVEYTNNDEIPNITDFYEGVSDILASIGIDFNTDAIIEYFGILNTSKAEALNEFLVNDLGKLFVGKYALINKLITNKELYKNRGKEFKKNSTVKKLAEIVASKDEGKVSSTVLGPEGNQYYMYAPNSFLTDFINNLNLDPNYLSILGDSVGKRGSRFLSQLQNGADISLSTFLGWKDVDSKTDSDYFAMSPKQDYELKAKALLSNRLPLPTISDKKFYGFLNGLTRMDFTKATLDQNGKYQFPEEVYITFSRYYKDELDRITKVKADIQYAIQRNNYDDLVANYHFVGYNSDGNPKVKNEDGSYTGNGTKLLMFKEFEGESFEFDKNGVLTGDGRQALKGMFSRLVYDEIQDALTNGFIKGEIDPSNFYKSKLTNNNIPKETFKDNKLLFATDTNAILNIMADIALNSVMIDVEMEKIFFMDSAFYKYDDKLRLDSYDDVTKRLAELVAPGQNLRIGFDEDEFNAGVNEGDEYTSTTIRSFEYSDDTIIEELSKRFDEQLTVAFGDEITDTEKQSIIANRLRAYKQVDATDAQVLISPNMYRQIAIRLGEWDHDKNNAFNRLMESDKDIVKSAKDIELVLQPLKLVYYNIELKNGSAVPLYDKMSLAVLLPQMVKGTKLEQLYDMMMDEQDPIDMVKFDSAVKVGNNKVVDYLDKEGNITENFKTNRVKSTQSFKWLRKQTVTDPHRDERRMVGTQIKKIILQNLRSDKVYELDGEKVSGEYISDIISKAYSALSEKGLKQFKKAVGYNSGKIDHIKLNAMLQKAAAARGSSYNLMKGLSLNPDGTPYVNLDTLSDREWIESMLISKVGEKTVDLITAGDSFIQMSAYGLNTITSSFVDDLKLIDSKGRTEVKMSVGFFKSVIPNYDKLSFNQKREWLEENFEGIGYRIPTQSQGSAIPFTVKEFLPEETGNVIMLPLAFTALTGSDFDIDKLFLIRKSYYVDEAQNIFEYKFQEADNEDGTITDETKLKNIYRQNYASKLQTINILKEQGLAVIRRREYIKLIDSALGGIRSELEEILGDLDEVNVIDVANTIERLEKQIIPVDKFIENNIGKEAYEINHHKAIENMIVDVMKSVLTSEAHVVDTKTPIDAHTEEIKKILTELDSIRITEGDRESFNWQRLGYQSRIKQFYIGGKFGIGPFALHNVHHALTQIANVGFNTILNPYSDTNLDLSPDKNNLAKIYDRDKVLITDWFSALINAHVDIAKDPYIFRLNVQQSTYNQLSYLLRLGFGKNAFYYINQPSIVEYPDSKDANKGSKNYMKKALELDAISDTKYGKDELKRQFDIFSKPAWLLSNSAAMLKQINKDTIRDAKWYAQQAGVLKSYKYVTSEATQISTLVQMSRIDGKGYGNNVGQIRLFDRRLQKLLINPNFTNHVRLFNRTFLGTIKKNSIDLIQDMYSNLTISSTDAFVSILDTLDDIVYKDVKYKTNKGQEYLTKRLSNEIFTGLVSNYFRAVNGRSIDPTILKDMIYGDNALGKQLLAYKTEGKYKDNLLLDILRPVLDEDTNTWMIATRVDIGNDTWTKNAMTEAWRELLTAEDKEMVEFAENLVDYSFYFSGFNKRLYSFYHYIPIQYLKDRKLNIEGSVTYDEFIGQLKDNLASEIFLYSNYYELIRDVMLNNTDLIPKSKGVINPIKGSAVRFEVIAKPKEFKFSEYPSADPFIKFNHKGKEVIAEYVGYRDIPIDQNGNYKLAYKAVEPKGFDIAGHVFTEYDAEEKSIVPSNNIKSFIPESETKEAFINKFAEKGITDFIYVEPNDRLSAYTNIMEPYKEDIQEESDVRVEEPIVEKETRTSTQSLLDENAALMNTIESRYGVEERDKFIDAINHYYDNPMARKLIEKLKECL